MKDRPTRACAVKSAGFYEETTTDDILDSESHKDNCEGLMTIFDEMNSSWGIQCAAKVEICFYVIFVQEPSISPRSVLALLSVRQGAGCVQCAEPKKAADHGRNGLP